MPVGPGAHTRFHLQTSRRSTFMIKPSPPIKRESICMAPTRARLMVGCHASSNSHTGRHIVHGVLPAGAPSTSHLALTPLNANLVPGLPHALPELWWGLGYAAVQSTRFSHKERKQNSPRKADPAGWSDKIRQVCPQRHAPATWPPLPSASPCLLCAHRARLAVACCKRLLAELQTPQPPPAQRPRLRGRARFTARCGPPPRGACPRR